MPVKKLSVPAEVTYLSILDERGNLDKELEPSISSEELKKLYRTMLLVREYDDRKTKLQRQGRIGTFAPTTGQEATQIGAAYALRKNDWLVPSFRDFAALIWRGMRLEDDLLYTAGYEEGISIHANSTDLPIAIPVASQIPHAVGIAWGIKLKGRDSVALTFFGDGATSEGDFHEGLNFAGVFNVPVIFVCENNQYAISLPRQKQTRSETLAQKALAYGIRGMQVDGNDILAMYHATQEAADRARKGEGPTLIEALTYRLSFHTTADDPTRYRSSQELEEWRKRDPLIRFRKYLAQKGILSDDLDAQWLEEVKEEVDLAVKKFEEKAKFDPVAIFDFTYASNPSYVERQRQELKNYLSSAQPKLVEVE